MFAKYSSEKFPLVFIFEALTFRKKTPNDNDFKKDAQIIVKPVFKSNFNFFSSDNRYNYYFLFETIKRRSKKENLYNIKNILYKKEISSNSQGVGLSNDVTV